ncbi:MAG: LysM peptidoglycan-binding domain-containing protein [Crocinitomicaceae bacterium]|nr:LysM peptidoglycan-binding domain-containing protein [Crocinitomicaceae bacterium]NGF75060.1 LysM peptidoglycan-binding domain-containing protein [Fluviicola sp. SGL-29]
MRFVVLLVSFILTASLGFAQPKTGTPVPGSDQFVNVVEQSLAFYYAEYADKQGSSYEAVIDALNYSDGQVVEFSDEVYCQRLKEMNKLTPFKLECNEATLSTIRFFAAKRRGFARIVLGRSHLYFDMYEAKLAEHGLPLELKYLSVIESGLRPQVKSRAGALGLWQFMYGTGKMFGLKDNSYIDERMDPEKATEAACRYLKQLYNIYGDWNLALAAYNAGPGNVNKAIRRSGNKTTYWEVRPFLPKETQGYVPNFIAAAYLLTYHAEHNIIPAEAPIHYAELDTICLSKGIHMSTITKLVGWSEEEIKSLNPIYKLSYIPETNPKQCIYGPIKYIGKLVSLEDSLYRLEESIYNPSRTPAVVAPVVDETPLVGTDSTQTETPGATPAGNTFYHKVQSGETLGNIATKYGTTINKIMTLNGMSSTHIYVGQRLKIESTKAVDNTDTTPVAKPNTTATQAKYYTVKSGDTFGKIAQRHGKSISQLRQLNPGINIDRLRLGQKLRVR